MGEEIFIVDGGKTVGCGWIIFVLCKNYERVAKFTQLVE